MIAVVVTPQVAALKQQAASNANGVGADGGAGKRSSIAADENDAAWEAKLAESAKAADEKLEILTARHNEAVEVRYILTHTEGIHVQNVSMLAGDITHCLVDDTTTNGTYCRQAERHHAAFRDEETRGFGRCTCSLSSSQGASHDASKQNDTTCTWRQRNTRPTAVSCSRDASHAPASPQLDVPVPPTPVVVALPGEAVLAKCPTSCAVLSEGSGLNNMSFLVARGGVGKEKGVASPPPDEPSLVQPHDICYPRSVVFCAQELQNVWIDSPRRH